MTMKINYYTLILSLSILLQSCIPPTEPEQFGVRESIWNAMSPEERQLAITGYNERQMAEIQSRLKQQEAEAQMAPYHQLINALSASKAAPEPVADGIRISSINKSLIILNNGVHFEVCPFIGNDIKHWMPGSKILAKKGEFGIWDMILINLDTKDQVKAKKL